MENVTTIVMMVIVVFLVREFKVGNEIARSEPSVVVGPQERFRTLRMQLGEPVLALVVIGSLLLSDLERAPIHGVVAAVGGIVGYAFGWYRARATYVTAYPEHKGIVLRYSIEAFVALGLLVVIKVVAELDLLPEGDVFRSIIAALLGFLVIESCARVFTLVRYYRRAAAPSPATE